MPFDLSRAPLWRALWARVAEDKHVLALTFHHSIVDEWSLRVFPGTRAALCGRRHRCCGWVAGSAGAVCRLLRVAARLFGQR